VEISNLICGHSLKFHLYLIYIILELKNVKPVAVQDYQYTVHCAIVVSTFILYLGGCGLKLDPD
jgi:hypothetical protein